MFKNGSDVSPYLRRRLRSYRQAMRDKDAKTAGATGLERIVEPNVALDQSEDCNTASEISKSNRRRKGETLLP